MKSSTYVFFRSHFITSTNGFENKMKTLKVTKWTKWKDENVVNGDEVGGLDEDECGCDGDVIISVENGSMNDKVMFV